MRRKFLSRRDVLEKAAERKQHRKHGVSSFLSSVTSKQTTVQPQRRPQRTSALPSLLLQREPLAVPENCVFGRVYDRQLQLRNDPFRGGCRKQHCLARQGTTHANKNNELRSRARSSESIHPAYKWQDAARGRRSHRDIARLRAGRRGRAGRASACGTVRAFPRSGSARARRPAEPHGIFHWHIVREICTTHGADSFAAESGSVLPTKKIKCLFGFHPPWNYLISSNTFAMI